MQPNFTIKSIENDYHNKNTLELFLYENTLQIRFTINYDGNDFYGKNALKMIILIKIHWKLFFHEKLIANSFYPKIL